MKRLFSLLALTASFCLAAADFPTISVPETKSVDDTAWHSANRFQNIRPQDLAPQIASAALWQTVDHVLGEYPARVDICHTKDSLIIILSGEVKEVKTGKGDGPYAMFGGCTAEIFLQPDPAKSDYYQFAVSPDNQLYQAKGWDLKWRPAVPVKTAAKSGQGFWAAKLEIPFAAFGRAAPKRGETWKANFIFGKSWSPTSDYHDPSQFGTLVFNGREPGRVEVDQFTYRYGDLTLMLTNRGTTAAKIGNLNGSGGETELLPEKTAFRTARIELGNAHKHIHKFGVRITQDDRTWSISGLAPVSDPDNFGLKKFYYIPGELPGCNAPGEYRFGNAVAVVLPQGALESVRSPVGRLALKPLVQAPADMSRLFNFRKIFWKLKPYTHVFTVNDVPFYPVVGAKQPFLRISGCLGSSFVRTPVTGAAFDADPKITESAFVQAEKDKIPTLYRIQYESQLAILTKDANGEVKVEPDQTGFYERAYKKLKKTRPDAVISLQADGAEQRKERIARCCDVFEYASWSTSYAPAPMAYLEDELDELLTDAKGKAVMFWLGCFNASGANRSAEELRAEIFLSLIKGCAGNVLHLGHGGLPKNDTHAQDLVANIQNEINLFYPDFVSGTDVTKQYSISGDKSGKTVSSVRFAVRRLKNGTDLLVAVNTSASAEQMCLFRDGKMLKEEEIAPYGVRVLRLGDAK